MARTLKHVDISDKPDLAQIAEEVRASQGPRALCRDGEDIAVVVPVKVAAKRLSPAQPVTRDLHHSKTTTGRVRQGDEDTALQLLARNRDKDFSFTDAFSFVVMDRLTIRAAFTFDHHFTQYGFTVLTPDLS